MRSAIYTGTLVHARRTPAEHVFRYPVCMYAIDVDEIEQLDRDLRLFSYNRPGILSLRDCDHLGDPQRPIGENVRAHLAGLCARSGVRYMAGEVEAAEEDAAAGKSNITPWWRVLTTDGKPNPKFPGGGAEQRRRLADEGVILPEPRVRKSKSFG